MITKVDSNPGSQLVKGVKGIIQCNVIQMKSISEELCLASDSLDLHLKYAIETKIAHK